MFFTAGPQSYPPAATHSFTKTGCPLLIFEIYSFSRLVEIMRKVLSENVTAFLKMLTSRPRCLSQNDSYTVMVTVIVCESFHFSVSLAAF